MCSKCLVRPRAERQTGSQLKAVRHDNAKELNFGIFARHMKILLLLCASWIPYVLHLFWPTIWD